MKIINFGPKFLSVLLTINSLNAQVTPDPSAFCRQVKRYMINKIYKEPIEEFKTELKAKYNEIKLEDNTFAPNYMSGQIESFEKLYDLAANSLKEKQWNFIENTFKNVQNTLTKVINEQNLDQETKTNLINQISKVTIANPRELIELAKTYPKEKRNILGGLRGCGRYFSRINAFFKRQDLLPTLLPGEKIYLCPVYFRYIELAIEKEDIEAELFLSSTLAHELSHSIDYKSKLYNYKKEFACLNKIKDQRSNKKVFTSDMYNESVTDLWAFEVMGKIYQSFKETMTKINIRKTYVYSYQRYVGSKTSTHPPGLFRSVEMVLSNNEIADALGCEARTYFNCKIGK